MREPWLSSNPDHLLTVSCVGLGACGHSALVDPQHLMAQLGDMPMSRLRRRLRCSRCGRRGEVITIATPREPHGHNPFAQR